MAVERILHHAEIATNGVPSFVEAIAIQDGKLGHDHRHHRPRARPHRGYRL